MFLLQMLGWIVFSCILMSFIEHQVHSRLMHHRSLLSVRFSMFRRMLDSHAHLHHGTYRTNFSDEPVGKGEDKGIRLNIVEGLLETLPVTIIIALFSIPGAIIFASVVAFHHFTWNQIHLEMHKPERRLFSHWSIYKFLARHHLMHHKSPGQNFNVVFPLADYVLKTNAKISYSDLVKMHKLGLLSRQKQSQLSEPETKKEPSAPSAKQT